MKQPELGLKVAELRQQKGLTQEKLAEYCEDSARTIQRIENGEVDPCSFTLNSLGNILQTNTKTTNIPGKLACMSIRKTLTLSLLSSFALSPCRNIQL